MNKKHYHVAPRYTIGNPALVPIEIAEHTRQQETSAYNRLLVTEDRAQELEAIVYSTLEIDGLIYLEDLITAKIYRIPVDKWDGYCWHERTDRSRFLFIIF